MKNSNNPHRHIDEVSLAYHTEIANRIERDPTLVSVAIANLARWLERKGYEERGCAEWRQILSELDTSDLVLLLKSSSEESKRFRQSSPFTGILTQAERRAILEANSS